MSVQKSDPHPVVATDPNGNTVDVLTSAPVSTNVGLVVRPIPSSAVQPTQDSSSGPTGSAAPADAMEVGGVDPSGNLQPIQMDSNKLLKTSNIGVGLHSYGQVAILTSATQIIAANTSRAALLVTNAGGATIYLGDASVTTSTGFPLASGSTIGVPQTSALYGVAAATGNTAGFLEFQ